MSILSSDSQTTPLFHRRAAAFSLSHILISSDGSNHNQVATKILLDVLQRPFLLITPPPPDSSSSDTHQNLSPLIALRALQSLLTNTDPSPTLISSLLTPIMPALFALWSRLEVHKTVDPTLRVSTQSILETWGRLAGMDECLASLWLIVNGEGGEWRVDLAGDLAKVEESYVFCIARIRAYVDFYLGRDQNHQRLSLFTPEDLRKAEDAGEFDVNANILHLRPDPVHFVRYLKALNRSEVTGQIFVGLLESYREAKSVSGADPMRYVSFQSFWYNLGSI